MKNISFKLIILVAIITGSTGCQNQPWEFDDFDYTSVYFPWSFPVRTLVLGDCNYDNTTDKNHQFVISAAMGGVYKNKENILVDFVVDPILLNNLYFGDSTQAKILPANYYTLSNTEQITIPNGKFNGGVTVSLTDAFFQDPEACVTRYVLPLRILSTTADSVLTGNADESVANPDRRVVSNWKKAPMDFTLFSVKYINAYHGNYLLRGKTQTKNVAGDNVGFPASYGYGKYGYVEEGLITPLITKSLTSIEYTQQVQVPNGTSPGTYSVKLTIDPTTNNVTVAKKDGSDFDIQGTGKFVKDGQEWGGKKRNALFLNFEINANSNKYIVQDTLVYRDNMVKVEEFTPIILIK